MISEGFCRCGCGRKTWRPPHDDAHHGYHRGVPVTWARGHQNRKLAGYKVEDHGYDTPCWVWQGLIRADGYGTLQRDGIKWLAHRYFYAQAHGDVPDTLDHLCRTPACVNPAHLEPCSRQENVRRGVRAKVGWDAVTAIRRSGESNVALAKHYGVAACTISNIRAGRNWPEAERP